MQAYISVIAALIGLAMFGLSSNPKVMRVGEILLFAGTLVSLFIFGGHFVSPVR